jgi:hypothetical protein
MLINKQTKKKQHQIKYILHNIHHLHPILKYFLTGPKWHRFLLVLLNKGVTILDLPMTVRLGVRDDKYGWAVVEKSTNHCVVRYKIIDMYIQRLNFSYFACIYLSFRLVTKSSVNPIW